MAERCAGLFVSFTKTLKNGTSPEYISARDAYTTAGKWLVSDAFSLELNDRNFRDTELGSYVQTIADYMANAYEDRMRAAPEKAGNVLADPLVKDDMATCWSFYTTMLCRMVTSPHCESK